MAHYWDPFVAQKLVDFAVNVVHLYRYLKLLLIAKTVYKINNGIEMCFNIVLQFYFFYTGIYEHQIDLLPSFGDFPYTHGIHACSEYSK